MTTLRVECGGGGEGLGLGKGRGGVRRALVERRGPRRVLPFSVAPVFHPVAGLYQYVCIELKKRG